MWRLAILMIAAVSPAAADVFVPTRVIRAREIISSVDVARQVSDVTGAEDVVGLEARITLYPNRPIRVGDVGPPAIVERNQLVTLVYATGGLRIITEGRALARGAAGDTVRVINLTSRMSVSGRIRDDGWIEVKQ